jgi:hypothetical protein
VNIAENKKHIKMPEIHVQKQLSDKLLTEDDKSQRIEELRKMIEGKFI